ncbi:MAG: hypothetical protein ACRC14_14525 [Paracoccaceae bacterium]
MGLAAFLRSKNISTQPFSEKSGVGVFYLKLYLTMHPHRELVNRIIKVRVILSQLSTNACDMSAQAVSNSRMVIDHHVIVYHSEWSSETMAGDFRSLSQLREVLFGMEKDLGLDRLAQNERDLLYAVESLFSKDVAPVRTEALKDHVLVREMPPATFHRTLKALLLKGFIEHGVGRKAGAFVPRRS